MCGHVVVTFHRMQIIRLAFLYESVKNAFHVCPYIRICILVYREGSGGMLDEKIQQACFGQRRKLPHYFARYKMKAVAASCQPYFNLFPHNMNF